MKIFTQLTPLGEEYSTPAVALGTFDGIHLGHQQIIRRAVQYARQHQGTSAVFTFSNHPLAILTPTTAPPAITSQADKAALLADLGVDVLFNIPISAAFLQLSPLDFVQLLKKVLHPSFLVVGPNYSFGAGRVGTPALLQQAGETHNFAVEIQTAVYVDNLLVSSTLIRKLIINGELAHAARLLGRYWHISGRVIHGDRRGHQIGFPTANLALPTGMVVPKNGVYAVIITVDGSKYNAIANVGDNPTFAGQERRIEIHIPGYRGNLYDRQVSVEFIEYLRDERKFRNIEQLVHQITLDIEMANQYYRSE